MMRRKDTVILSIWRVNLNHHLWNHNGTWFVHYTVHGTDFTKQRLRRSLQTKCRALRGAFYLFVRFFTFYIPAVNARGAMPSARRNMVENAPGLS